MTTEERGGGGKAKGKQIPQGRKKEGRKNPIKDLAGFFAV